MDHAVRQQLGDGRDASLVGQVSRGEDQRCFLAVQVGELAIASVVTDMQDPVTPVLKAALAGEELHDAGRVIARLSRIVDHGAAAIDENLLRVRAVEIYLGHVQPPSNATVPHDAMRPLPPSRTPPTLAQNASCAPSATPGLSTTTSSSGELSTEPGNDDLHVGPLGLRLFNGTLISARTRGWATMARRLSPMKVKRKITSRHGVDSRPLSE